MAALPTEFYVFPLDGCSGWLVRGGHHDRVQQLARDPPHLLTVGELGLLRPIGVALLLSALLGPEGLLQTSSVALVAPALLGREAVIALVDGPGGGNQGTGLHVILLD